MTQTRRIVDRGRLKELREDAGLTHRTLAGLVTKTQRSGSASYLSKIESGHPDAANVSPLYLKRIADALGVRLQRPVNLDEFSTRVAVEDAA